MEIVRAAPELAGDLTRIALAAKRHWQYPERWIEIWTPALTIAPDYVATNPTFAAVEAGDPLGFYALVPAADRSRAQLDHLWILPERIGNGLGRALFEHAVATARSLGAAVMDIEAEPYAEPFYRHMGARRTGERTGRIEDQPRVLPLLELALVSGC
ncbi:MAG TPA: GNAT family N-acetyltransferase [Thermoanaerobaculia bacterium]|jgi:GNAT superfamily N-acetyltransferase|nr:GNAT family N-acetyltransferase [Thermoanaerobaculia bacterium]